MNKQTFLQLSLLFPYILWIALASVMFVMFKIFPASESLPILSSVITISYLYTIGILIWGIPYSILALGLLAWSKRKPFHKTATVFAFSPFMLTALLSIEMFLILQMGNNGLKNFVESMLFIGRYTILYGYGIICIVVGLYKFLQTRKMIEPVNETSPLSTT